MTRALLAAVGILVLLGACSTQRLACPAYQSSFIYDKETLRQKFSYFKEDSTPKVMYAASKTKYLVAVPESYRRKYRRMQTIEMKPVYPVIPDSLKTQTDEDFSLAEVDENDSTALTRKDSTYAITRTKEKFNLDQDLYMWYFRDLLVLPDVRAAMQKNAEKKEEALRGPKEVKEKKSFFGGLKNLFKKKPKSDSTSLAVPPKDVTEVNAPAPAKKKGGLFRKNKTEQPVQKKDPAKKKEEGEGF